MPERTQPCAPIEWTRNSGYRVPCGLNGDRGGCSAAGGVCRGRACTTLRSSECALRYLAYDLFRLLVGSIFIYRDQEQGCMYGLSVSYYLQQQ